MPFFPDGPSGGGAGDYKIDGTNVVGGHDSQVVNIGDNNMTLGNNSGQEWLNANGTIAIGNTAAQYCGDPYNSLVIGYRCLANGQNVSSSIVAGNAFWHDNVANLDNGPFIQNSIVNAPSSRGGFSGPVGSPPLEYERGAVRNSIWLGVDPAYGYTEFENVAQLNESVLVGQWRGDPGSGMVSSIPLSFSHVVGTISYPLPAPPAINAPSAVSNINIIGDVFLTYVNGDPAEGHAIVGYGNFTDSNFACALGAGVSAENAPRSIAIGQESATTGDDAIAIGAYTSAAQNEIVIGDPSISWNTVMVGGIDLKNISPGGSGFVRETSYMSNWPDASFASLGMSAITTTGTVGNGITGFPWDGAGIIRLTSAGTAGASSELRANGNQLANGNQYDWEVTMTFSPFDSVATSRTFVGLRNTGATGNIEPSAIPSLIGIGADSGDANLQFMHRENTSNPATKYDLGSDFPKNLSAGETYVLTIKGSGNSNTFTINLKNLGNGATFSATETSNIPMSDLTWDFFRNNASTAAQVILGIGQVTIKKFL